MTKKFCSQYTNIDKSQKRTFKRIDKKKSIFINNIAFSDNTLNIYQGTIINISASGLVFTCKCDKLIKDNYIQTIFKLDEADFNIKSKIHRKFDTEGYCTYAVEFHLIKDSVRERLSKYISKYI